MQIRESFNFLQVISAVLPVYDEKGANVCQVFYMNGESQIVPMPLTTFLNRWTFAFGVHLGAQRMWARGLLFINNRIPLLIDSQNAFFPVKTRQPVGLKDSCHGFIHLASIERFDETGITLRSGITIPCISTKKNIIRKMLQADHLLHLYRAQHLALQGVYATRNDEVAKQLSLFYDLLREDTPPPPPHSY